MKKTDKFTAGEFRFPVTIQGQTNTPDGAGGFVVEWRDRFLVYCSAEQKSGKEDYGDGTTARVRSFNHYVFVTWWRDDIGTLDRLIMDGQVFNVRSIANMGMRFKFLQIVADSGVEQ